ncbi:MAG: response regulator [Deltaproteobacteria bacterium]|nr:response regulator [Deltaproteobacteria bacterium]MCB9785802.1 response regulator [Deltaproteobacteria bacterium]
MDGAGNGNVNGRVVAGLLDFAVARDGAEAVHERLLEAGLARWTMGPTSAWVDDAELAALAAALGTDGERPESTAREAGFHALTSAPLEPLAGLVDFFQAPEDLYAAFPSFAAFLVRGPTLTVPQVESTRAVIQLVPPASGGMEGVVLAFLLGLLEGVPALWRLARGRCDVSVQASGAGDVRRRYRFEVTWSGTPSGPAHAPTPLQAASRETSESLTQGLRLASLGRLAAATAHEFNNALTGILGYADLGLQASDPATRERAFNIIRETGAQSHRQVAALMRFSRGRRRVEPEGAAVDLGQIAQEVSALVGIMSRSGRVRVELDMVALPRVSGRRNALQQIVLTVVQHAIEAMPAAGGTVRIQGRVSGDRVRVEVSSDEPGDRHPKTPPPVPRVTPAHGLARELHVVALVAKAIGSQLEFLPGRGEFPRALLTCPVADREGVESPRRGGESGFHVPPGGRGAGGVTMEVLVVDDEPVIRTLLADIISHRGHVATPAVNGSEAWKLLAQRHYDVVFLDVLMPVMSGLELLERMQTMSPRPQVVIMSGKLTEAIEETLRRHPGVALLSKPFPMQHVTELLDRQSRALAARSAPSDS